MTSITLHPAQSEIYKDVFYNDETRYTVGCCSRGLGKSVLAAVAAMTAVHELMALPAWIPNKKVFIVGPTFDQTSDVYFDVIMYELGAEDFVIRASKQTGRLRFANNVELRLVSYESIAAMRGKGTYFLVLDEVSDFKKGMDPYVAWQSVIKPCLVTRWSQDSADRYSQQILERTDKIVKVNPGRALIIGTPAGFNMFSDMMNYHEQDSQWATFVYDYTHAPYVSDAEVEHEKEMMDPRRFASEYLALVQESGNSVFYMFNRKKHVTADMPEPAEGEDIYVGIDFNVGIQASGAFIVRDKKMYWFEDFQGAADTSQLTELLCERFKGHKIYALPDPTGKARKTSAAVGATDFNILEAGKITILAHRASPPIVDSANAVNRMLETAGGTVSMYFHPRCKRLISSVEKTTWLDRPDSAIIDKKSGVEHHSDYVRYATEFLFPIIKKRGRTAMSQHF